MRAEVFGHHEHHNHSVTCVDVGKDGSHVLSGSLDHSAILWNHQANSVNCVHTHAQPIFSVALSPDSSICASGGRDTHILVSRTNPATPSPPVSLLGHTDTVTALSFPYSKKRLVSGGRDGVVRLWDISRQSSHTALPAGDEVLSLTPTTSPSTVIYTAHISGQLMACDFREKRPTPLSRAHNAPASCVRNLGEHSIVSCSEDGSITVTDVRNNGHAVSGMRLDSSVHSIGALQVSDTQWRLAVGLENNSIGLFSFTPSSHDVFSKADYAEGHRNSVMALWLGRNADCTTNTELLVSASRDHTVCAWHVLSDSNPESNFLQESMTTTRGKVSDSSSTREDQDESNTMTSIPISDSETSRHTPISDSGLTPVQSLGVEHSPLPMEGDKGNHKSPNMPLLATPCPSLDGEPALTDSMQLDTLLSSLPDSISHNITHTPISHNITHTPISHNPHPPITHALTHTAPPEPNTGALDVFGLVEFSPDPSVWKPPPELPEGESRASLAEHLSRELQLMQAAGDTESLGVLSTEALLQLEPHLTAATAEQRHTQARVAELRAVQATDTQTLYAIQSSVWECRERISALEREIGQLAEREAAVREQITHRGHEVTTAESRLARVESEVAQLASAVEKVRAVSRATDTARQEWAVRMAKSGGDPDTWRDGDISQLLLHLHLAPWIPAFTRGRITPSLLFQLEESDLLLVTDESGRGFPLGAARLVFQTVCKLTAGQPMPVVRGVGEEEFRDIGTVESWSPGDVRDHLIGCGVEGRVVQALCEGCVGGAVLISLSVSDMHILGIEDMRDIVQLRAAIDRLREDRVPNQHHRVDCIGTHSDGTPAADTKTRDASVPERFLCPITQDIMRDPVVADDGHSYERSAIEMWLAGNCNSPMTGEVMPSNRLVPNYTLRAMVGEWIGGNS